MSEEKCFLTKFDLIETVAAEAGSSKVLAGHIVDSFMATIARAVKRGDKVVLRGFATFEAVPTAAKPAKTGRNPRTGEPVAIEAKPAGKRVSIKAKFPAE